MRARLRHSLLRGAQRLGRGLDFSGGGGDLGLGGIGGGLAGVELGPRHETLLVQLSRPLEVELRFVGAHLGDLQIRPRRPLSLGRRPSLGLERRHESLGSGEVALGLNRVDAGEHLPALDAVALLHRQVDESSHHARADVRVARRDNLARSVHVRAEDVAASGGLDVDGHGLGAASKESGADEEEDDRNASPEHGPSPDRPQKTATLPRR